MDLNSPFRFPLEAEWAKVFDIHGIRWVYNPDAVSVGLRRYDSSWWGKRSVFWLPAIQTLVEVVRDLRNNPGKNHARCLRRLYKAMPFGEYPTSCVRIVIAGPHGRFKMARDYNVPADRSLDFSFCRPEETHMVRCRSCGAVYFVEDLGVYECPACANYDGPRTFDVVDSADCWQERKGA